MRCVDLFLPPDLQNLYDSLATAIRKAIDDNIKFEVQVILDGSPSENVTVVLDTFKLDKEIMNKMLKDVGRAVRGIVEDPKIRVLIYLHGTVSSEV